MVKQITAETHPLIEGHAYRDANEILGFNGVYRNMDQIRVIVLEQL